MSTQTVVRLVPWAQIHYMWLCCWCPLLKTRLFNRQCRHAVCGLKEQNGSITNITKLLKIESGGGLWGKELIYISIALGRLQQYCVPLSSSCAVHLQGKQDPGGSVYDATKFIHWSDTWQMPFNVAKCQVMHLGKDNQEFDYFMGSNKLEVVKEQRDLGVHFTDNLKSSRQCQLAYSKARKVLGMIGRMISYKNADLLVKLYKSLVYDHIWSIVCQLGLHHIVGVHAIPRKSKFCYFAIFTSKCVEIVTASVCRTS